MAFCLFIDSVLYYAVYDPCDKLAHKDNIEDVHDAVLVVVAVMHSYPVCEDSLYAADKVGYIDLPVLVQITVERLLSCRSC